MVNTKIDVIFKYQVGMVYNELMLYLSSLIMIAVN